MEKHCSQNCPVKLKCHKCKEEFVKLREFKRHIKLCQVMGKVEDEIRGCEELGIFFDMVPLGI